MEINDSRESGLLPPLRGRGAAAHRTAERLQGCLLGPSLGLLGPVAGARVRGSRSAQPIGCGTRPLLTLQLGCEGSEG